MYTRENSYLYIIVGDDILRENQAMKKKKVRPRTTLGQGDTGGEGVLAPSPLYI